MRTTVPISFEHNIHTHTRLATNSTTTTQQDGGHLFELQKTKKKVTK